MTVLEYLQKCKQDVDVYDEDYDEGCAFCWDDSVLEQKEPIDRFNYQLYKRLEVTFINDDCICANVSSLVRKHLTELKELLGMTGDEFDEDEYDTYDDYAEERLVRFFLHAQAGYSTDKTYTKLADAMEKWEG